MINRILIGGGMVALGIFLFVRLITPNGTTVVSVIEDITDVQKAKPQFTEIESLFGLKENQWKGAVFRYSNLTDVSLNVTQEKSIADQCMYTSNEFERAKEINDFFAFIKESLSVNGETGRLRSSVYLPIARELLILKNKKAEEKILLVYSDLMENDSVMTFYNPKMLQKVISSPDTLKEYFDHKFSLPELNGITVYFIYQPPNTKADAEYQVVSGFYKELLESKGATVHVQANI